MRLRTFYVLLLVSCCWHYSSAQSWQTLAQLEAPSKVGEGTRAHSILVDPSWQGSSASRIFVALHAPAPDPNKFLVIERASGKQEFRGDFSGTGPIYSLFHQGDS